MHTSPSRVENRSRILEDGQRKGCPRPIRGESTTDNAVLWLVQEVDKLTEEAMGHRARILALEDGEMVVSDKNKQVGQALEAVRRWQHWNMLNEAWRCGHWEFFYAQAGQDRPFDQQDYIDELKVEAFNASVRVLSEGE